MVYDNIKFHGKHHFLQKNGCPFFSSVLYSNQQILTICCKITFIPSVLPCGQEDAGLNCCHLYCQCANGHWQRIKEIK
jgi:hypothetical protein